MAIASNQRIAYASSNLVGRIKRAFLLLVIAAWALNTIQLLRRASYAAEKTKEDNYVSNNLPGSLDPRHHRNVSTIFPESSGATHICVPNRSQMVQILSYPNSTRYRDIFHKVRKTEQRNQSKRVDQRTRSNEDVAVCVFRQVGPWTHFAHSMQQLYRCLSFFREHSNQQSILSIRNIPNAYSEDFIGLLKSKWNVHVDYNGTFAEHPNAIFVDQPDTTAIRRIKDITIHENERARRQIGTWSYAMHSIKDIQVLREGILGGTSLTSCDTRPTIGVLNRDCVPPLGNRHILNHEALVSGLNGHFGTKADVRYLLSFDNKTMLEQVQWMSTVDILVSPHGAQLTSLPFLRGPCATVLELFPMGFYLPDWYGPLAAASSVTHASLYTGDRPSKELGYWMSTTKRKQQARSFSICVNLEALATALDQLIARRNDCICPTTTTSP